jgi:hypothetical protein
MTVKISKFTGVLMLLVIVPAILAGASQSKNSEETGSVSGYLICERGSLSDGVIELWNDEAMVDERYIYEDWNFEFEEVRPGTYYLAFKDIGEIPIGDRVMVEVTPGKTARVTITIPHAFSGMPCDEMLELGWDGYNDAIDDAFREHGYEYSWLSEMGLDRIAQAWGDCKLRDNDQLIAAMPDDQADEIWAIRETLMDFEYDFYNVLFFGGTGAFHNATRTVVGREIFIEEVMNCYGRPRDVDQSTIDGALNTLKQLKGIVEGYNAEDYGMDEEGFRDALSSLRESATRLRELASGLRSDIMVMVADYAGGYLVEGLY